MKQNDIRRIMNHVFSNFSCPNCNSSLHKGDVSTDLNSALGIIFSIDCPECATKVKVNGFLPPKKIPRKILNQEDVSNDIRKITKFSGRNLADLFNE